MPVQLLPVPYGAPATAALDSAIGRAQERSALDPVTVLTPTVRSAVHLRHAVLRRRADRGGALASVHFLVLARFAELLGGGELRSQGLRRLTRADVASAIRVELRHHPALLDPAAAHPSSEAELVERYEELRSAGPAALVGLGRASRHGRDLALVFSAVRRRLEVHCYDDVDLYAKAAEVITREGTGSFGAVIVHLPDRLRATEEAILEAIGAQGEVVVLRAAPQQPLTPDFQQSFDWLSGELRADSGGTVAPLRPDRLLVAPDAATEVREGVRIVLGALAAGALPERVALLHTTASPYASLVSSELAAAGLEFSGRTPEPLPAAPTARFLLHLLRLRRDALGRSELFALLDSAPALNARGDRCALAEWDRCSRLAGIIEGDVPSWKEKLSAFAARARRSLARLEDSEASVGRGRTAARDARSAVAAVELAAFVVDLDAVLSKCETAGSWADLAAATRAALDRLLGPPELRAAWPGSAGAADLLVLSVLDELAGLDVFESPPDLEHFAQAAELALRRPGPYVGRLGSGLHVGPLEQVGGLDLDLVVVLGAADGQIPSRTVPSPLLSSTERTAAGLEVATTRAVFERDHHRLFLALSSAARSVVTFSGVDRAGRPQIPSRLFARDLPPSAVDARPGALDKVANGSLSALSFAELEAALLFMDGDPDGTATGLLRRRSFSLDAGVAFLKERRESSRSDRAGVVQVAGLAEVIAATPFSPTSLEGYAACPFRYFLSHLLALEVIEDPGWRLFIDPRDRGSIVHEVLERFVRRIITEGPSWEEAQGPALLVEIADEVFGEYERRGLTGKSVLWRLERRRLMRMLESERRADALRRDLGVVPVAVEHTFGLGDAPAVVSAAADRRLAFRGMIDRVDVIKGAEVSVIDYKTGRPTEFRRLRGDPVDRGRHLQLAIYGLAAREAFATNGQAVSAAFRFVGDVEEDIAVPLDTVTQRRFEEVLAVLVRSIDSGAFPYRPGDSTFASYENCRYCDFDSLCPSDREQRWEQVRLSPKMADYRALVEDPYVKVDAALDAPAGGSPVAGPTRA